MEEITKKPEHYGKFYMLLKRLPGADKETLVEQYTRGRTIHLRDMTLKEYELMCSGMERVAGEDERRGAYREELRKARSGVLKQMQLWGVDTTDWKRVDAFCLNKRIAGKMFRYLDEEELAALKTKLRIMIRKKKKQDDELYKL